MVADRVIRWTTAGAVVGAAAAAGGGGRSVPTTLAFWTTILTEAPVEGTSVVRPVLGSTVVSRNDVPQLSGTGAAP